MLIESFSNESDSSFLSERCNPAPCLPIRGLILTLLLQFKYKEVYEHIKANGYTLGPNDVPFVNVRRINNVTSEVL